MALLGASAMAQGAVTDPGAAARRLLDPRARPAAMQDLVLAGAAGAHAVFDAFLRAAAAGEPEAAVYAAALAGLGTTTSSEIPRLVAAIPLHGEPLRSHLLRALANGALLADGGARATIRAALAAWADAGLLYSPSATEPTFAWYEYVRLVRRLGLAAEGGDAPALQRALDRLRAERSGLGVLGGRRADHQEIEAHGAHGQREVLEGIAELVLACPGDVTDAVAELAGYLANSPPRPPILKTETCAGIGENAPNRLPGAHWPTLWRYDEWHFACARAVLARHPEAAARQLALRHLLHASDTHTRLLAIETVRQWPRPWLPFAAELAACLQSDERLVVREALVTIGQCPETSQRLAAELARIANGGDRELAALARRAGGSR